MEKQCKKENLTKQLISRNFQNRNSCCNHLTKIFEHDFSHISIHITPQSAFCKLYFFRISAYCVIACYPIMSAFFDALAISSYILDLKVLKKTSSLYFWMCIFIFSLFFDEEQIYGIMVHLPKFSPHAYNRQETCSGLKCQKRYTLVKPRCLPSMFL